MSTHDRGMERYMTTVVTLCYVMLVWLWTTKREMGDEDANVMKNTS